MPVWLYWSLAGLFTYIFNVHQQRQAALQSIDVGLLMIKASSAAAAANATSTTTIQSLAGVLKSDSNVSANVQQQAKLLSRNVLAPDWLALATATQAAGYPVLANSIASMAMTLLESGQLEIAV